MGTHGMIDFNGWLQSFTQNLKVTTTRPTPRPTMSPHLRHIQSMKQTPSTGDLVPAPLGKRIGAYIVDYIILTVAFGIVGFIFGMDGISENTTATILLSVVCLSLAFGYGSFFIAKYSFTPGKKLFKLKVVAADGSKLGILASILRETIWKFIGGCFLFGQFWALFNEKKKASWDFFSGSLVVEDD